MFGVFIFRRDLRIHDNKPLLDIFKKCSKILPIFIFDPYQVDDNKTNSNYRSVNSIQFMLDCLDNLNKELNNKLKIFYGKPLDILKKINKQKTIDVISFNDDFSYYSQKRDNEIKEWCKKEDIEILTYEHDNVIVDYDKVLTNDGEVYKVFSSYYKKAVKMKANPVFNGKISKNIILSKSFSFDKKLKDMRKKLIKKPNNNLIKGGRDEANKILSKIGLFQYYNTERDLLNCDTTRLSAYLKFGCVSIREVYKKFNQKLNKKNDLTKQLYWRSHYFVLARYENFKAKYGHIEDKFKKVKWDNNSKLGKLMWSGKTGFPIIDAGVRELNETGFMHNRARLLVANFCVKILHISPFGNKWSGQEYFSRMLIDCCYANNYGNWMWILGPYDASGYRYGKKNTFSGRIFRDIVNFKKWDKELEYVRKWIPELKDVPDKDIINWNKNYKLSKYSKTYLKPIVDFDKQIEKWYKLTKK